MKLDRAEVIEIMLIAALVLGYWGFGEFLPGQLTLGNILLDLSALLLLQGLVRDLWLLSVARRIQAVHATTPQQPMRCMCVESTVGATGVALGLILLGTGFSDTPITLGTTGWTALILLVLVSGFIIKDWVFEFSPFTIRRDKHHMNIIVGWGKR